MSVKLLLKRIAMLVVALTVGSLLIWTIFAPRADFNTDSLPEVGAETGVIVIVLGVILAVGGALLILHLSKFLHSSGIYLK